MIGNVVRKLGGVGDLTTVTWERARGKHFKDGGAQSDLTVMSGKLKHCDRLAVGTGPGRAR